MPSAAALRAARDELWRLRLPYSPHVPTAPQARFLLLEEREALYGGAAGGGKSDALLMGALQHVHVPGYAAVIFRRTFADLALPGAIMDRAREWLAGSAARWNENTKTFTFPTVGVPATLTFAYLEHDADRLRYQGAEFHYIAFDELTQFSEVQYRYLFSRCRRTTDVRVPLRVRSASNPGGPGHEWVLGRFIAGARNDRGQTWEPNCALDLMASRLWERKRIVQDDLGRPVREDRAFVPAKLEDNPFLDAAEYEKNLAELDPVTRAQLRRGDWSVRPKGPLFDRTWFKLVDDFPREAKLWRYWDLAATPEEEGQDPDWTSGAKVAEWNGTVWVVRVDRFREAPGPTEARIRQAAELDGRAVPVTIEQEPGSSGVITVDHYRRRVLRGFTVYGDKKTGSKVELARPLSALAQAGGVNLIRGPWVGPFLDEAEAFPFGSHDDQVDAVTGAHRWLTDDELIEHSPTPKDLPRGRMAEAEDEDLEDDERANRRSRG